MKKVISHVDRLNSNCPISRYPNSVEPVFVDEQVEENGVIVRRSVLKSFLSSDRFNGMKCSDFQAENLLAIGAVEHFRSIPPLSSSISDSAIVAMDSLVGVADNLDSEKQKLSQVVSAAPKPSDPIQPTP